MSFVDVAELSFAVKGFGSPHVCHAGLGSFGVVGKIDVRLPPGLEAQPLTAQGGAVGQADAFPRSRGGITLFRARTKMHAASFQVQLGTFKGTQR